MMDQKLMGKEYLDDHLYSQEQIKKEITWKNEFDELLKLKLWEYKIIPDKSKWNSNISMIKRKNKAYRIIINKRNRKNYSFCSFEFI